MEDMSISGGIKKTLEIRSALVESLRSLVEAAPMEGIKKDEEDEVVSLEDVKTIVDLMRKIGLRSSSGDWKQRSDEIGTYCVALARQLPPKMRAQMLLGNLCDFFGEMEDELLGILCGTEASDADVAATWKLLRAGKINVSSAWLASRALVEHALRPCMRSHEEKRKSRRSSSGDDDWGPPQQNPTVSPAESFLVLLAMMSPSHDKAIALRISQECDPRLGYQPSASPTRVEGELLGQVSRLARARGLSPAVLCRRDVGIVFDNKVNEFYRYDPDVQFRRLCLSTFGPALSVELPHLVYALVDHVEVDVDADADVDADGPNELRYVSPGTEVMLRAFSLSELTPRASSFGLPTTITTSLPLKRVGEVCTHVSIAFKRPVTVVAVRVYGRAIVW